MEHYLIFTKLTIDTLFELAQKVAISLATRRTKYLIIRCLITGMVKLTSQSRSMSHDRTPFKIFSISYVYIYKRAVRLFFDLLHGIKRIDVPLIMMLEFMVFLGYDGKLDANSDMEKDLFSSAIDQLKEGFIILGSVLFGLNYAIFESIK